MRGIAIALLAGLLAAAAPTAQALCAVDEEGGCSRIQHFIDLEVAGECPDSAQLCIIDRDGNLSTAPNDADWDITLRNAAGSAFTFELYAIGFYDENGEPVTGDRVAAQLLTTIEVPDGQSVFLDDVGIPANVSHVRVQALAEDERQAEQDAELANYRIMMMQPGDGPVDEGQQGNLDDDVPADEDSKDAPALPLAVLVLACIGAVLVARRVK